MKNLWWIWPLLIIGGILIWRTLANDPLDNAGGRLYRKYCASCHLESGQGLGKLVPDLRNHPALTAEVEALVCLIRQGKGNKFVFQEGEYHAPMPGHPQLSAQEISSLINFLRDAYLEEEATRVPLQVVQSGFAKCSSPRPDPAP
ncbi:MAG: cytochrome c [Bacteroidota bacterium]